MKHSRFISRYGSPTVGIQSEKAEVYMSGEKKIVQKHIEAKFDNGLLTDDDFKFGLQVFSFPGLPEDRETEELASPRPRMSIFDSAIEQERNGWTDEETQFVIDKLRLDPGYDRDFVEIELPPAEKPWARYDDQDSDKVLELADEFGDVDGVLAYERENKNRAELIEALEGLKAGLEADSVVIQA